MKKTLKIIIPTLLLGVFAYLFWQAQQKTQERKEKEEALQEIPDFVFGQFSRNSLEKGKATIFIHFNSSCEYCQYEAKEIYKHREALSPYQMVMVSGEDEERLQNFVQEYQLQEIANLRVVSGDFWKYFTGSGIPDILIYDGEAQLKKRFRGETKIEAVLKVLAQ